MTCIQSPRMDSLKILHNGSAVVALKNHEITNKVYCPDHLPYVYISRTRFTFNAAYGSIVKFMIDLVHPLSRKCCIVNKQRLQLIILTVWQVVVAFPVFPGMMHGGIHQKWIVRPRKSDKSGWNRPAMLYHHLKVTFISGLVSILEKLV